MKQYWRLIHSVGREKRQKAARGKSKQGRVEVKVIIFDIDQLACSWASFVTDGRIRCTENVLLLSRSSLPDSIHVFHYDTKYVIMRRIVSDCDISTVNVA